MIMIIESNNKKDEIVSINDVELLDVDDIISYRKNMETLLIED